MPVHKDAFVRREQAQDQLGMVIQIWHAHIHCTYTPEVGPRAQAMLVAFVLRKAMVSRWQAGRMPDMLVYVLNGSQAVLWS